MSRELLKRAAVVLRDVWDNDDCYCAPSVIELQKEIVAYLNLPEPDQSARIAELTRDTVRLMETITDLRHQLAALQAREPVLLSDGDIIGACNAFGSSNLLLKISRAIEQAVLRNNGFKVEE